MVVPATVHHQAAAVDTPYELTIDWTAAEGASALTVDQAYLTLSALAASRLDPQPLDVQASQVGGNAVWNLTFTPAMRIRSISLDGLARTHGDDDPTALANAGDLDGDHRLTLGPSGEPPRFAVPAVGGTDVVPGSPGGTGFSNGVLSLPDLAPGKLRVAVVSGDPGSFAPVNDVVLGNPGATGVRYPTGPQITDPDGAVVWASPRELLPGSPALYVDLKMAVQRALAQKLKSKAPLRATFKLTTSDPARVMAGDLVVSGALLWPFRGVTRTTLIGDPVALALPQSPAIDASTRVVADVTARYDGVRLLAQVSDPLPPNNALRGRILGAEWRTAALPPDGLKGQTVARIGLIGRAPEPCEVSVRLVRPVSGDPLAIAPAVLRLDPRAEIHTVWFSVPPGTPIREPVSVAARATRGRFYWATDGNDKPLVRIAVVDLQPAAALRVVKLGGKPLSLGAEHQTTVDLTAHFPSATPVVESDLFYTLDLSDLTFRYLR
jgi:hypothetical protein